MFYNAKASPCFFFKNKKFLLSQALGNIKDAIHLNQQTETNIAMGMNQNEPQRLFNNKNNFNNFSQI